jgi:Uncharacterised nucleotidyltransferase
MSAVWTLIDLLAGRRDPASLDDREWEAVISVARAEVLAATLAERLADAALPPQIAALFADLRAAAKVQQNAALWEAEMARRALEPVGVRFVLLKGTAYAAAGLPCAAGRQIGDLDIMVAREDLDRAEAALLAAGWEWVKSDPYDDAYYRNHMHELPPLIHKDRDRMIDVHHTILPLTHRATPDAGVMLAAAVEILPGTGRWHEATEGPGAGVCNASTLLAADSDPSDPFGATSPFRGGFNVLAPADMVIHCAAHVMADGDLSGGLRNLWDFGQLIHQFPGDWEEMVERAELHGLGRAFERASRLDQRIFFHWGFISGGRGDSTDPLFVRALTARDDWGRPTRPFTRLFFTIRSHWLRMPPLMLARHLWVKWRRVK